MMRDRRLGELEQRHELAHAHLPGMLAQHVDQLQADGVAERLGDLGQPVRLLAVDVGVSDRLAAGSPAARLVLGANSRSTTIYI